MEGFADRIDAGIVLSGERLIDHGHERRVACVGRTKSATVKNRNGVDLEEMLSHIVEIGVSFVVRGLGSIGGEKAIVRHTVGEDGLSCDGDRLDAGNPREPFFDALMQRNILRRGIARYRRLHLEEQQVSGIESEVGGAEMDKGQREKPRTDNEQR